MGDMGHLLWGLIWLIFSIILIAQFFYLDVLGGYVMFLPIPLLLSAKEFIMYFKSL